MAISQRLATELARKASMRRYHPDQDLTELDHLISEIRIADLVEAKITEFPGLLVDPARRERLAALLSDGQADS